MPKVPIPAQPPGSISPTLWNGENREDILAFLGDLNAAYLFYGVMKGDPDPESSAIDEANAAKVDKITNLQKAQYLAQADVGDDVVYWYSFSNHYTKRAFTQP